jgi:hypothetical protein
MPRFSATGVASILFLAATGPGLAQASNPYANMKPFGSQPPSAAARVPPTQFKSNAYYDYRKSTSNIYGNSIVGIPTPKPPY